MGEDVGLYLADADDNDSFTGGVQAGANAFVASTDRVIHGVNSYKLTFDGSNLNNYKYNTYIGQADVYARCYFNIDVFDLSNGQYSQLFNIYDGTTVIVLFRLYKNASGIGYQIRQRDNSTGITVTIDKNNQDIFSLDTDYYIETRWLQGASSDGGVEFWINGVSEGSDFSQSNNNYEADRVYIGPIGGTVLGATSIIYLDDIKIDTSPIGAYSVAGGIVVLRRRRM